MADSGRGPAAGGGERPDEDALPDGDLLAGEAMTPRPSDQLGSWEGKSFEQWLKWEGRGVPLRDNCDLTNPRQALLWMFTALPGAHGAPLVLPIEYWEVVSWRQWMLGARPDAEPTLKYQAPRSVTANPWTAAGQWVPMDTPDTDRPTIRDLVAELPQQDQAQLHKVVLETLGMDGARPDTEIPDGYLRVDDLADRVGLPVDRMCAALADFGLQVEAMSHVQRDVADRIVVHLGLDGPVAPPDFDPAARSVTEVLGYLREASRSEVARVLAAERAGRARRGVLKRYPEEEA